MSNAQNMTQGEIEILPAPTLEQLERQATAFLYAIWRARGMNKRIVEVVKKEQQNETGLERTGYTRNS